MKIAVVGAGAIGCLFGAHLQRSGQNVLLVNHNRRLVASIKRNGLTVAEKSGKTSKIEIYAKQYISKLDKPDLVLLTVKAYDTAIVATELGEVLDSQTPILSLQNGLGNFETLSRHLPGSEIFVGTTTEPALMIRPGFVKHQGSGVTWVGPLLKKTSSWVRLISRLFNCAGFPTRVKVNIESAVWSKAIANSAINPVSALAHVSNGQILSNTGLRKAALRLLNEGIGVARASGINPAPPPRSLFSRILESTANNKSSMLRDIEARRKTEIRQLNGSIASYGKRLGVPVPANSLITDLVVGLEASESFHIDRS